MLQVTNLHKCYGNKITKTEILKGVDLQVNESEFVAVMGQSGSGKTTLLNCIATFIPFDEGNIRISDTDINNLGADELAIIRNKEIGAVFQDFMLMDGLTRLVH